MTFYRMIRPLLFRLDAERAHELTVRALALRNGAAPARPDPLLAAEVAGLRFPNPIGLAPGFDKDARCPDGILSLGFGFAEVGTLTPRPQAGNPKPRLFRLVEDRAVINRMGFNNEGQQAALARLSARRRQGVVGVNIGANKDSADRIADYEAGVRTMEPVADYLTINISSPNTPGLRALQSRAALDDLLARSMAARTGTTPVFLKVAPDLTPADVDDIAAVAVARGIAALIVSNTTIERPPLASRHAGEAGGLSGAPLAPMALQRLRDFRAATGGTLPLVSAGGIGSADEAWARIRAGASLVQLYSALVYEGPGLARAIAAGLSEKLRTHGFARLGDAVGTG